MGFSCDVAGNGFIERNMLKRFSLIVICFRCLQELLKKEYAKIYVFLIE